MFHSGNTNNENDYELCLRAENVYLPQFGYFGISAATGGLADDHDVLKFLTYSLVPQSQVQTGAGLSDADKQRFSQEYEQYKEKLEKQRDDYLKAHPDEARRIELESDKAVESEYDYSVRELQQIFQGQSEVFDHVKTMNRKLDEIIGRQERALSLISSIQSGTAPISNAGAGNMVDSISLTSISMLFFFSSRYSASNVQTRSGIYFKCTARGTAEFA